MESVDDLKDKCCDLHKALSLALAKNKRLSASKSVKVDGCLEMTPKIEEPKPCQPKTICIKQESGCCPSQGKMTATVIDSKDVRSRIAELSDAPALTTQTTTEKTVEKPVEKLVEAKKAEDKPAAEKKEEAKPAEKPASKEEKPAEKPADAKKAEPAKAPAAAAESKAK